MSDTLYIGDIPQQFHFARYGSNYIDLFNTETLRPNQTYTFYRVYMYDNYFTYYQDTYTTGSYYSTSTNYNIPVSNKAVYRRDFSYVMIMTFIFVIFGVWLLNLFTSIVRKGGIFGGLL